MRKRKWIYVMKPYEYSMLCDKCGGKNIEWSEFEHKIWCFDCKIDTDGNGGIFDGPIPMLATEMIGLSLARYYLKDRTIRYPIPRGKKIVYTKKRPEHMAEYVVKERDERE